MLVKFKPTGQLGTIDDNEYDPNVYEQVGGQTTQTPVSPVQQATVQQKTMTGHTPQEIMMALQKARQAGDTTAEADINDMYAKEIQYQKDLASGAFQTPEEKANEKAKADAGKYKNDIIGIATQLQNTIANKSQYKPEEYNAIIDSYTSALTAKQKEASNFGASLTGNELAILAGQIPVRQEIGRSIGSTIKQALTGEVPVQTGRVVDNEEQIKRKLAILIPQLQGKDVSPDMFNSAVSGSQTETAGNPFLDYLGKTAQNVPGNTKDILNGLLGLPAAAIQGSQERAMRGQAIDPISLIQAGGLELGKGLLNEANQVTGRPLEGGDIVGRAAQNFQDRPVSTLLYILPFLGGKLPKGIGAGARAGKAGEVASTAGKVARVGEEGNILTKLAEGSNELITGGGTKDLISKNVMLDEAQSLSKSLLDHNIQGKLTTKGKIVQTQKALSDVGSNLEKMYKKSPAKWTGNDLNQIITDTLKKEYGGNKVSEGLIQQVKDSITQRGGFDIGNNDSLLSAKNIWDLKKAGEEFGKSAYNIPETGPLMVDMAKTITRVLREKLNKAVPEAQSDLRDYGNLKTYMDDVLSDPKGLNVQRGGLVKGSVDLLKQLLEKGNQTLYNIGRPKGSLPDSIPQLPPKAQSVIQQAIEYIDKNKPLESSTPPIEYGSAKLIRDMRTKQGNPKFRKAK